MDVYLGKDYLLSATASKKNIIKVAKFNRIGKMILDALKKGEELSIKGTSK